MAEGWARHLRGDVIDPYSAGIAAHGLNPSAVAVMAEAGVDISHHQSKTLDVFRNMDFDWVITVCDHAHDTCPVFPGPTRRFHRNFDDPPRAAQSARSKDEALDVYRRVRDEIREFVVSLPEALENGLSAPGQSNQATHLR